MPENNLDFASGIQERKSKFSSFHDRNQSLRSRLQTELEAGSGDSSSFSIEDPLGLVRDLEASGRFQRDSGLGLIFHPGKISFREKKQTDSLHILIDHNVVSGHIDRHSPLRLKQGRFKYSLRAVVAHNFRGMAEDVGRFLRKEGRQRCEIECERIAVDGRVMDDYLRELRTDVIRDVEPEGTEVAASEDTTRRVPFNVIDEAVQLLDNEAAPWSIQLEVRVAGSLDEARLRAAIIQAVSRHPMARAKKVASPRTKRQDWWEVGPSIDLDPLRVITCPDESSLSAARSELQSLTVPLSESPPLRARLARNPGGDYLMLNFNHAATDGFGALRILHSIAREYAGQPDPQPRVDFLAARDLPERLAAPNLSTKMRRYAALAEKVRDLAVPPARLAAEQATDEPGYGFHHECLSERETKKIVGMKHRGKVNDVLVAALHLAIAEWNQSHGAACDRVGVLVPANLRPPKWRDEIVGNFSLPARISTTARDRKDHESALEAVTGQTTRKKQTGMGTALIEVMKKSRYLPMWAKQASVALLPLTGNRLIDTAMISNLGRIEFAPWFGHAAGETLEMWFSAPARMPLGLSLGACTVMGRLHLAFRYRHRLFDPYSAGKFAECYLDNLREITQQVAHGGSHPWRVTLQAT